MKDDSLGLRLCLVRHGETEENLQRLLQGHMPGTLTVNGKQQAVLLRDRLCLDNFDVILSSDLKRVTDTVRILLDGRTDIPWQTTDRLREIDWGSMTGMRIADIDPANLAPDVETREMLYERAASVVRWLRDNFQGKTVLVVSHGLFLRSLTANLKNIDISLLHTIERMENCGIRWIGQD
ncbi:MAG: histidine phosphatase family protein [Prevotella sp.]|nr:histidine phosphatase family protein [Prevotella sp.]